MSIRSLARLSGVGAAVLTAGALVISTMAPASAGPIRPAWGKTQEGDTITLSVDFKQDWSAATYATVSLNPFEDARDGHFHLFGPNGTIRDSPTKRWGANERDTWNPGPTGSTPIGKGKLFCSEFWNTNNTRHGGITCVTAD